MAFLSHQLVLWLTLCINLRTLICPFIWSIHSAGTVSWIYHILCSVSIDDKWFTRYLSMNCYSLTVRFCCVQWQSALWCVCVVWGEGEGGGGVLHFMPINSYKAKMLHYLKAKSNCIEQSNKQPAWETDYFAYILAVHPTTMGWWSGDLPCGDGEQLR